jgi:predicted secreted Zn-dependent protease
MTIFSDDQNLRGSQRARRLAIAAAAIFLAGGAASAGSSSTAYLWNDVGGATPSELVAGLRSHPLPAGGSDAGFASIQDRYEINIDTRQSGGLCRPAGASVDFHFAITLPRADETRMSAGTKRIWRSFVAFSKRHEEEHRSIFLGCAQRFERAARSVSPRKDCAAVREAVIALFADHYARCLKLQDAFDRKERGRLDGTELMRSVRGG